MVPRRIRSARFVGGVAGSSPYYPVLSRRSLLAASRSSSTAREELRNEEVDKSPHHVLPQQELERDEPSRTGQRAAKSALKIGPPSSSASARRTGRRLARSR